MVSPDQDHFLLIEKIRDEGLKLIRLFAPVKEVSADYKLFGAAVSEIALFLKCSFKRCEEGMDICCNVVFQSASKSSSACFFSVPVSILRIPVANASLSSTTPV